MYRVFQTGSVNSVEICVFVHVLILTGTLNFILLKIILSPLFEILKHFLFTYATEEGWEKGPNTN